MRSIMVGSPQTSEEKIETMRTLLLHSLERVLDIAMDWEISGDRSGIKSIKEDRIFGDFVIKLCRGEDDLLPTKEREEELERRSEKLANFFAQMIQEK